MTTTKTFFANITADSGNGPVLQISDTPTETPRHNPAAVSENIRITSSADILRLVQERRCGKVLVTRTDFPRRGFSTEFYRGTRSVPPLVTEKALAKLWK